jgi:hypothetical protein
MRFRKIALALFAWLALGPFAANFAQAAEGEGWTIEGTKIASGTHQSVSCEKHGTSTLIFTSTLLGESVELSAAGGIECVTASIDNTMSPGHSEGILRFLNIKVLKPSTKCNVPGGTLQTTFPLTDNVVMDPTFGSTAVFDKFVPWVGVPAILTVRFEGAECPLAEAEAPVKGSLCGESVHTNGSSYVANKTGELFVTQTLLFGATQQTTGGCALTLGNKAAGLAGAVDNKLAVTNVGKTWGAD